MIGKNGLSADLIMMLLLKANENASDVEVEPSAPTILNPIKAIK